MKTIEEVIDIYNKKVEMLKEYAKECDLYSQRRLDKLLKLDAIHLKDKENYLREAEEYEQVVEWLNELKNLRERM